MSTVDDLGIAHADSTDGTVTSFNRRAPRIARLPSNMTNRSGRHANAGQRLKTSAMRCARKSRPWASSAQGKARDRRETAVPECRAHRANLRNELGYLRGRRSCRRTDRF